MKNEEPVQKPSAIEKIKVSSQYLRGDLAEELTDGNDFFGKESIQLLKFHGTYQQDNRDLRSANRAEGKGKAFCFMVRTKIPGGKLTSAQLLAELDLCDEIGTATLRITTRQGLQLHGILKHNLRRAINRINEIQLSTLAACGDVERNVICCPAPHYNDPVHQQMQDLADQIAAHLCPRTTAYHELWVTDPDSGERKLVGGGSNGHVIEPIYGENYMPRKFKTAIAPADDNCIDLYANDVGLMGIVEEGKLIGYNVLVGGSFGVTPAVKKTFPALAKRMCFIKPEQALDMVTAIVGVQRDFGNRSDRKVARMKYLIHEWGLPKFKAKVEEYFGQPLAEPHPTDVHGFDDHMGWNEQGDGRWFYGLNVENGRIYDDENVQMKTAFREICRTFEPRIRLTGHQSILFCDIEEQDKDKVIEILRRHNVPLTEDISTVRRWSMACVAWPTCGLAITESERALPGMIDELEVELAKLGLSAEKFTVRMTGCPNGCARPYNSDIGLVGKAAGRYTIFLGGRLLGDRLNTIYKDLVPAEEVIPTLMPVFAYFKEERQPGETFGDFCDRKGMEDLAAWSEQFAAAQAG
jgi:sulfite reductase (ferredoxin)